MAATSALTALEERLDTATQPAAIYAIVDEMRDLLKRHLAGWQNQMDLETEQPLHYAGAEGLDRVVHDGQIHRSPSMVTVEFIIGRAQASSIQPRSSSSNPEAIAAMAQND